VSALIIARLTFREAFRRKVIWGVALLSLIFVVLYIFGFHLVVADYERMAARRAASGDRSFITRDIASSLMVLMGLYTVNFLAGVMTIFAAVGAIAGEVEAGTLHAIVPKPLSRWEILLGKYLGFAVMIAIYIATMVAAVAITARLVGGYTTPRILTGTLLIILVSLILLSLTILGSTIFSTVANGVVVFMLYGLAATGGLVEQIGTSLNNDTLTRIGVISSVIVPSDSMWRLASYLTQPRLANLFIGPNPFGTSVPPSPFAVHYAMVYCGILFLAALVVFRYRDL
jgi:Cu-processing system permease protein